jgi:hypothetical protein
MKKKSKTNIKLFNPDVLSENIRLVLTRDLESKSLYWLDNENNQPLTLFREAQHYATTKKYKSKGSDAHLRSSAINSFIDVNSRMHKVNTGFNTLIASYFPLRRFQAERDTLNYKLGIARRWLSEVLSDFTTEELFEACKHANGTTFGIPYENSGRDQKLRYPISCTAGVEKLFELYLEFDPQLKNAVEEINSQNIGVKYWIVQGSRTTTVPKNDKTDRTIAIEPTLNMFFQQGLMALMYNRLKTFGLDLSSVPKTHHLLAEQYSISLSGATVDFSSASDSVSLALCEFILPHEWLRVLTFVRSKETLVDGCWHTLSMISTMGNATTFPLETLVFASLIVATETAARGSGFPDFSNPRDWSVFGDDCILPVAYTNEFIELAEAVGFAINHDKTYFNTVARSKAEKFRESCGVDYVDGRNIRPFYLRSPEHHNYRGYEAWLYTVWNGCLKKYITYFGNRDYVYGEVFSFLIECLNQMRYMIKIVPDYFPDDSGIKINSDPRLLHLILTIGKKVSPLLDDRHGGVRFSYLRFEYDDTNYHNGLARLWDKLKFPVRPVLRRIGFSHTFSVVYYSREDFDVKQLYRTKRKGGYKVTMAPSQGWLSKPCIDVLYSM